MNWKQSAAIEGAAWILACWWAGWAGFFIYLLAFVLGSLRIAR